MLAAGTRGRDSLGDALEKLSEGAGHPFGSEKLFNCLVRFQKVGPLTAIMN
jgi:hypothetical protein